MSINCKNGLGHSWKKSLLSGNALVMMMMITTIMVMTMVSKKYIDFDSVSNDNFIYFEKAFCHNMERMHGNKTTFKAINSEELCIH